MALISRGTTWIPGDILTAAALNGEFNIVFNAVNGGLDETNLGTLAGLVSWSIATSVGAISISKSDTGSGDLISLDNDGTGESILVDNSSTGDVLRAVSSGAGKVLNITNAANDNSYLSIDGTGVMEYGGALTHGWVSNLGLSLTSGQLKLVAADGTDLSDTNPAWIALKGDTDGQLQVVKVTTATNLFDDATTVDSDIAGEEFGTTAAVEWATQRPYMLYFAKGTTNDFFFISPNPTLTETPSSSTNIGYHGNPMSSGSDDGAFALTSTNVTADTSKPCVALGAIRMTKDNTDDWTVVTLDDKDGIGKFHNFGQRLFDMEPTQMGAATDFMKDNGGQAPEFSTESYKYAIDMTGNVTAWVRLNGDGGNDGNGAFTAQIATPYFHSLPTDSIVGDGLVTTPSYTNEYVLLLTDGASSTSLYFFRTSAKSVIQNGEWTSGNRTIAISFEIKAFS